LSAALCGHYHVKEVRSLGFGNIEKLISMADKHGKHQSRDYSVLYEGALCVKSRLEIKKCDKMHTNRFRLRIA
jgi:hypothetical protein